MLLSIINKLITVDDIFGVDNTLVNEEIPLNTTP